jgi:hypothetical protein
MQAHAENSIAVIPAQHNAMTVRTVWSMSFRLDFMRDHDLQWRSSGPYPQKMT